MSMLDDFFGPRPNHRKRPDEVIPRATTVRIWSTGTVIVETGYGRTKELSSDDASLVIAALQSGWLPRGMGRGASADVITSIDS